MKSQYKETSTMHMYDTTETYMGTLSTTPDNKLIAYSVRKKASKVFNDTLSEFRKAHKFVNYCRPKNP